jgi:LETM1 and EF-hand domain-containing protein 1
MSLWLPRSPPIARVAIICRNRGVHPHVVKYWHVRRVAPRFLQPDPLLRFQSTKVTTDPSSPPSPPPTKNAKTPDPLLSRVWNKIKHEAQHYWHGSKLLAKEVRISARLQSKILQGETLTRRERRQVRTDSQTTSNANHRYWVLSFDGRHKICFE